MSKEENEITSTTAHGPLGNLADQAEPDLVLDAQGLYCPEPVMMVHTSIRKIDAGQTLCIIATDPSTVRDIPKFCLYLDHELLFQEEKDGVFTYLIKKNIDA